MQYIEATQIRHFVYPSVFLAGGITNCPDWQAEMRHLLRENDITVVNPRRADFPIGDPNAALEQIEWEYDHLRKVELISFWFSVGSLNPIVLFELGAALERDNVKVVVGCHPDYERRQDVEIQTELRRHRIGIVYSLPELAIKILEELL